MNPTQPVFGETSDSKRLPYEPAKPSKTPKTYDYRVLGVLGVPTPCVSENYLPSRATTPTDIEAWRDPFAEWLTSRCAIHPRCNAGLNSLLAKYSEWEIDHVAVPVAPTREVFIQLLAEHGFSMVEAYGTVLVYGLAFCEDIDAILGKPGKRIGSVDRKVKNVA